MNRRESVRLLAAALGAAASGAGYGAAIGDRVQWADVTLLDGRVLPATALARPRRRGRDLGVVVPVLRQAEPACSRSSTPPMPGAVSSS